MTAPVNPNPPEPAGHELEPVDPASLGHDGVITEFSASDCSRTALVVRGITASSGELQRVNLSDSNLEAGHLTDLEFRDCDLANLRSLRTTLTRVRFRGGRLTGMVLLESALYDVTFEGCRIDLSSFADSKLVRVRFQDCLLTGTSLMNAECESVAFEDCRMTEADFRGAKMKDCQIRRCDLIGIEGTAGLRGVAMEWADIVEMAPVWAAALGLVVIDTE